MKTLIINILITFALSAVIMGLIYFILNKAFSQKSYKNRFFANLIVGIFFFVLFIITFIVDYEGGNIFEKYYTHLILIVVSFTYPLLIIIGIFNKVKYTNVKIINLKIKNVEKNYLYVLFKYSDSYLLKRKKEFHHGYIYKMKTSFHDEAIEEVVNTFDLGFVKSQFRGKIKSKDKTYYCYLVQVDNLISGFEKVSMFDLVNLKVEDFDKEAILTIILKEDFNIEI